MNKIRAIVFDMDGVLVDAKEWHYDALNSALQLFGCRISEFEHISRFDGLPTRTKLQMLTEERDFPAGLHDFVNSMKQLYTLRIAAEKCSPNPQHVAALTKLKQEGYVLGVASNSIRNTVERLMEITELDRFLSFTLSNQDVAKAKPDPEIYRKAISLAGVKPSECVVVEDNPHGIQAAQGAGAHVMQVATTSDVSYERIREFMTLVESAKSRQAA